MNNAKLKVKITGRFSKDKNTYIFKNDLIICERKGSLVSVEKNLVSVQTDVTGIDKIYVEIKNNTITISNVFKDFISNDINNEFNKFQELKGYVPYPYTLLKNVIKTPPGLITYFYLNEDGVVKYYYEPSEELELFTKTKNFKRKTFKRDFAALLRRDAEDQKELVPSFSGGFDSLFLTWIYRNKVKHILHFSEDNKININYYKKVFPDKNWIVINGNEPFSEKEKRDYFKNLDEPGCDSAGFAEYMMIKKLNKEINPGPVMNGQSSDTLFNHGKKYLQEYISYNLPFFLKNISENNTNSWLNQKLYRYSQDTQIRFESQYLSEDYKFSDECKKELQALYDLYYKNIKNDSVHFLAAMTMMLIYPVTILQKINTTSHIFKTKYYLPFLSSSIIKYAYSIPSRHKVGFKMGKRILANDYKEVSRIKFISRDFKPEKLKEKFIETKLTENEYRQFYIRNWMKYNVVKNEEK